MCHISAFCRWYPKFTPVGIAAMPSVMLLIFVYVSVGVYPSVNVSL
jgi:hypothetical protein